MDGQKWQILIEAVLTVLGALALYVFQRLASDVRLLSKSVEDLNIKMAIVVTQQQTYHDRIERVEKVIDKGELAWKTYS